MPASAHDMPLPLAGVRVVDLTQVYSGPYATFLLAQAGAEVIKIEPPGGEGLRNRAGAAGTPFAMFNANKKSVSIDLKSADGRRAIGALLDKADVLVENFRPGVAEELELVCAKLRETNPRLICASLSGYGLAGPYRDYPALDICVQAMGGVLASTGFPDQPPVKAGAALADISSGVHLFGAITAALYERERTGVVRDVHIAMLDSIFAMLASSLSPAQTAGPEFVSRTGNRHGSGAVVPYNVYPALDGYFAILCTKDVHWRALAKLLGLAELAADPELDRNAGRVKAAEHIDAAIAEATRQRPRAELFELLATGRVPCGPVRELWEVMRDPHLWETGMLMKVDHPRYGSLTLPASPLTFDGSRGAAYDPSHELGADADVVLVEIAGLDPGEVADLRARKVIV